MEAGGFIIFVSGLNNREVPVQELTYAIEVPR